MIDGVEVSVLGGELLLVADDEAREEIRDGLESGRGFWTVFSDILERYFTNGKYQPFDAGNGNPFVGLSDAPCIAESIDVHDDGAQEIVGRFWYFANYMVECPLETLAETGKVKFQSP